MIPSSLRTSMKEKVHASHIGINSSFRSARDLIYSPQMSTYIRNYVDTCGVYATYADKQHAESMVMTETSDLQWQKGGTDLFSWSGRDYVVKKASFYIAQYPVLRTIQSAFTLYFPDRLIHSDTISASLGSIQPYATINARRLLVHISTTYYHSGFFELDYNLRNRGRKAEEQFQSTRHTIHTCQ